MRGGRHTRGTAAGLGAETQIMQAQGMHDTHWGRAAVPARQPMAAAWSMIRFSCGAGTHVGHLYVCCRMAVSALPGCAVFVVCARPGKEMGRRGGRGSVWQRMGRLSLQAWVGPWCMATTFEQLQHRSISPPPRPRLASGVSSAGAPLVFAAMWRMSSVERACMRAGAARAWGRACLRKPEP